MMRPHLDEWSGETMPSTLVIGDVNGEVRVDIFPHDVDLHDGQMHSPIAAERFLTENRLFVTSAGQLAIKTLKARIRQ